jgi:hypothetical protein
MNTTFRPLCLIAALTLAAAPALAQTPMSKDQYKAEKDRIQATHKVDVKACDGLKDNAKDVCKEEAKGKEKVALAELEHRYTGKAEDATKVQKAKAEANYEVAKERCDDQAGAAKDACKATAKAEFEKARPS